MTNPEITDAVDRQSLLRFDMVIDVRSPGEFAEDHVPGAVNLPVLDNQERAVVGTIYVRESRFRARRVGAALVARNVARHLEVALADQPGSFKPLVYCWRGGQRSNAMATILAQVGWRTAILNGGYKTYRRHTQARLYTGDLPLKLALLDGGTGCGKTEILRRAANAGVQVIDLEALACHRGSLFGGLAGQPQPSQKLFESNLLHELDQIDLERPVLVEAESSKIGARVIPPVLWRAMERAPRIELNASSRARASFLVEAYADIIGNRSALDTALTRLQVYPGRKRLKGWAELADAGDFVGLAQQVIDLHYDPAYGRSSRRDQRARLGTIDLRSIDEPAHAAAALEVAGYLKAEFGRL